MKRKRKIQVGVILMIAILAMIYLYSYFDPSDYPFFPKCPVYMLTGYECPGCGSQRAFYNFFQGNFLTAFRYNPLMFALIPYVLWGIYIEYIAHLSDGRMQRLRNIFYGKWATFVLAVIIIVYTILRNMIN